MRESPSATRVRSDSAARPIPLDKWELVGGLSPDGSLLALTAMNASPRSIRFLDVVRKRWHGAAVPLPTLGTGTVRWADDRTAIVSASGPTAFAPSSWTPTRRRIVRTDPHTGPSRGAVRRAHTGWNGAAAAPASLPPDGARARGCHPSVGRREGRRGRPHPVGVHRSDRAAPRSIADPSSSRAYVFGGLDEPVADVDLRAMAVKYRTLRGGPPPLMDTLGCRAVRRLARARSHRGRRLGRLEDRHAAARRLAGGHEDVAVEAGRPRCGLLREER